MSDEKKKVLLIAESKQWLQDIFGAIPECLELIQLPVQMPGPGVIPRLDLNNCAACVIDGQHFHTIINIERYLENQDLLESIPDGFAIVDPLHRIVRCNFRFAELAQLSHVNEAVGGNFYELLGSPEIFDLNMHPFDDCRQNRKRVASRMRNEERQQYFQVEIEPILDETRAVSRFFVFLTDITQMMLFDRKLQSLQTAGRDLANLTPSELLEMTAEDRLNMLKQKIVLYTDGILKFGNFEVRLLSHTEPGLLEPLVAEGMTPEAMERRLYRAAEGNGITGYVAFTGERYLMDDADTDPLYLPGATGAKSSITVPLFNQGEVVGTFNVESMERNAFTRTDLELLETFARDVAHAINTMELLSVEQMDSAFKSIEAVHGAVAGPVNAILLETSRLLATFDEMPAQAAEMIRDIQNNALDIQQVIHKVGAGLAPAHAQPMLPDDTPHPLLKGRRIFVADPDESVCISVNSLLRRYGCIVEMAPDGAQVILRARVNKFDAILSDIKLPDMNGYELFLALRDVLKLDFIPLILMKGYGYDPAHVLTKAKADGVIGFLSKPFILDQVLTNIEKVIETSLEKNR